MRLTIPGGILAFKPVIKPPPADQVKDITDLAAKQARRSGLGR